MSSDSVVPVNVQGGRYDIVIRRGLLFEIGDQVAKLSKSKKAALITDSHVGPRYAAAAPESLSGGGIEAVVPPTPAGEDHKTLADLLPVFDALLGHKIERATPVLALGGGVIGDMAGFVAA